jgi:hypothetical protein
MQPPAHPSLEDTAEHRLRVYHLMLNLAEILVDRGVAYDFSKTIDPEVSVFDEFTPKLATSTYGSEEYKGFLAAMKPALDHHYAENRHHPEHYPNGVTDMTLVDLLEMVCDWKAASERHKDGDIMKSIEINAKRFHITAQLWKILENTVAELWPKEGTCKSPTGS